LGRIQALRVAFLTERVADKTKDFFTLTHIRGGNQIIIRMKNVSASIRAPFLTI
jgi:hypothetical protein